MLNLNNGIGWYIWEKRGREKDKIRRNFFKFNFFSNNCLSIYGVSGVALSSFCDLIF